MVGVVRRLRAFWPAQMIPRLAQCPCTSPALYWKRATDLVLGGVMLLVFLPLMAAIATVILVDSGRPILFRQQRIGRRGEPFTMLKFRSMYSGSDDKGHRLASEAWFAATPTPNGYKRWDDRRVTRIGRILRRTSLDELPQLFNVVRGEISLVGPRPAIPYELVYYQESYFQRQAVRPGMTGLWQVLGRNHLAATEMIAWISATSGNARSRGCQDPRAHHPRAVRALSREAFSMDGQVS